jgi:hypothetical protein
LVELFRALRDANGWAVEWVSEKAPSGPYEVAKKMLAAERREMLLNAATIGEDDYVELDERVSRGATLTREERVTHERNHFERAVGVPLDETLVELNADGKLLKNVTNLASLISIWAKDGSFGLVDALLEPTLQPRGRLQAAKPEFLIAALMRTAGLTTAEGLQSEVRISLDGLSRFVDVCRENRTMIEEAFGEPYRGDFADKPVRQLNLFLRRIGLHLKKAKTVKVAGRKVRFYGFPAELLATMMRLAQSYLAVEARKEAAQEATPRTGLRRQGARREAVEPAPATGLEGGLLSSSIRGTG